MRKSVLFLVAALGVLPVSGFAADTPVAPAAQPAASQASAFTEDQRREIENIIKSYLTEKHPEVLGMGLQALQKHEQEATESKIKEKILGEKSRIFNDPATPTAGKPNASVTVVEFFDYQCGYCRATQDAVERILKDDKDVKVVYKNFPILGAISTEAAKASLASVKQGKFLAFHNAIEEKKDHLSSESIYLTAKDVGLNVDMLKKDMNDKSVSDALDANLKLGQDIGVRGTPFFIVNDSFFPGVMQYDQLKNAVNEARTKAKQ